MIYQKRDFRQELTDSIIEALEKGVSPWQQGWQSGSPLQMPFNPTTEKSYRGGNVIGLMVAAMKNKFNDPRWLTYKQAESNGWQVRRGERGTQVEFWKAVDRDEEETFSIFDDGKEKDNNQTKFIHRVYTVFNASQIEGIPELPQKFNNEWESIQSAETILKNSGVPIIHSNQGRAFYRKSVDTIFMPLKEAFSTATEYYSTALHELAHASGARHRLNRETLTTSDGFGSETYAREELRAELTSVFLAAERGIPYNLENNAAYIGYWLDTLKEDKNEIFRAARDAHKATDFLLAFEHSNSLDAALATVNGKPAIDADITAEPTTAEAAREIASIGELKIFVQAFTYRRNRFTDAVNDAKIEAQKHGGFVITRISKMVKSNGLSVDFDNAFSEIEKIYEDDAGKANSEEYAEILAAYHELRIHCGELPERYIPNVPHSLNQKMLDMGCEWDRTAKQWYHTDPKVAKEAMHLVNEALEKSPRQELSAALYGDKSSDFQHEM